MKNSKKIIFAEYVSRLISRANIRFAEFWKMKEVEEFLKSSYPVSIRGINRYLSNIQDLHTRHSPSEIKTELYQLLKGKEETSAEQSKTSAPLEDRHHKELREFYNHLLTEKDFSPNTAHSYANGLKSFYKLFAEMTQPNVLAYKAHLMSIKYQPSTINLHINALCTYCKWKNIPLTVKRLKVPTSLECNNVPNAKEMDKFLRYCESKNRFWYLVFRCLSTTGLRCHEVRKITYGDILSGMTQIIGKGAKARRIFFQKEFIDEVREWMEEKSISPYEKFCPRTTRGIAQQMRAYAQKSEAGDLCKFHPHAFRHYFAKRYLEARPDDLIGLQGLLGHASVDTTSVYLRRSREEMENDYRKTVSWR